MSDLFFRVMVRRALKAKAAGDNRLLIKYAAAEKKYSSEIEYKKFIRECKRQWALGNRGDDWWE